MLSQKILGLRDLPSRGETLITGELPYVTLPCTLKTKSYSQISPITSLQAYLDKREQELMEKMRRKDLKDTKKAIETRLMLDTMQIDSKRWPTLGDINEKIHDNVILPQTILNYGEYYNKLQNLAFYAEQGDHESMQRILDKEDIMEKKNLLLQPIYRDLKSQIKHMTMTEEYKLLKEFYDGRLEMERTLVS